MTINQSENQSEMSNHWSKLNPNTLPEMMKHWYSIKEQYPDFLIAYRMGDFYEFFYNPDVELVSSLLGLTKTFRGSGPNRHPLAGIPHKATQHFKSLIKQGQTVVVVEQLESPKDAQAEKRIVKRGVVRILSPGTIIDESLLDANENNYLVSISKTKKMHGVAFIDLSCGDFFCMEFDMKSDLMELLSIIARFNPVEGILPPELFNNEELTKSLDDTCSLIIKQHSQYAFQYDNAYKALLEHFGTTSLDGFGVSKMEAAVMASGAIINFLSETQKTVLKNVTKLRRYQKEDIMYLDANTQRNLEILHNLQDNTEFGSLLSILKKTVTPMGSRMIKQLIVQPLLDKNKIEKRLQIVEFFKEDTLSRNDARELLSDLGDVERIISRINYSRSANARDLVYLKNALKILPSIKHTLIGSNVESLSSMVKSFGDYSEIVTLIEEAISPEPPTTITDGDIIRDGYDSRVDEMRNILKNGKDWILKFEEGEKQKLGISAGFKVGFNRVLGYYIQITDRTLASIELPEEYIQRTTLKGSTRYETNTLKEMEIKILNADETIKDIEYEIFSKVRDEVAKKTEKIQEDAQKLSLLDILCSFSEVAAKNNYCKPIIMNHDKIIIKNGRHPVIESINVSEPFIPNDSLIDTSKNQLLVITGPNWSGKSTYLRQVALITIMAQIGSYVPADSAEIGIVDRVFTRIGASDDLTRGQSTFMLEMNETAQILHYATGKSLVIIDELGRGTSTSDGKAIAHAVMEDLDKKGIKTLFSTHFHELTNIPLHGLKNYHFLIREEGKKLVFLRKLVEGGTDKSYGVHVAEMAGVPNSVVNRAFELVENGNCIDENINSIEVSSIQPQNQIKKEIVSNSKTVQKPKSKKQKKVQTLLFMPEPTKDTSEIVEHLKKIEINTLSPIDALKLLDDLKKKVCQ